MCEDEYFPLVYVVLTIELSISDSSYSIILIACWSTWILSSSFCSFSSLSFRELIIALLFLLSSREIECFSLRVFYSTYFIYFSFICNSSIDFFFSLSCSASNLTLLAYAYRSRYYICYASPWRLLDLERASNALCRLSTRSASYCMETASPRRRLLSLWFWAARVRFWLSLIFFMARDSSFCRYLIRLCN